MKSLKIALSIIALSVLANAQTGITRSTGETSFSFNNSNVITTQQPTLSIPAGNGIWWTPQSPAFASGAEIRKDNGKGITLTSLVASAKPINPARLASANYVKLANKLGIDSAAIDEACMLATIHDLNISTYDFDKVDDYLYRQALKQGTNVRWVWKPLRSKDLDETSKQWFSAATMGSLYPTQYAHAIPERVLTTISDILAKEPNAIFLVSDYEVVKPDPFLAVTTLKMLKAGVIFIVDRWDEPGFRDDIAGALRVSK